MKALVIDDSRTMRRIVSSVLRGIGYEAIEAGDGQEALDALQANDGVILCCIDWNMPVMDGLTATKQIRKHTHLRSLPIIAMTAHVLQEDVEKSIDAGMNAHLTKPINHQELISCLSKFLSPARATWK